MRNRNPAENLKETEDISQFEEERCSNPWRRDCGKTDIVIYLFYQGKQIPICHGCWGLISSKDTEWVYD